MKLLANENFPAASTVILREAGYDVYSIDEDNPSVSDDEVMKIAISENRCIITFDRDYGELIFNKGYRPSEGVIYLRVEPLNPEYPAEVILKLFEIENFDFKNALTVVSENRVRQRKY